MLDRPIRRTDREGLPCRQRVRQEEFSRKGGPWGGNGSMVAGAVMAG